MRCPICILASCTGCKTSARLAIVSKSLKCSPLGSIDMTFALMIHSGEYVQRLCIHVLFRNFGRDDTHTHRNHPTQFTKISCKCTLLLSEICSSAALLDVKSLLHAVIGETVKLSNLVLQDFPEDVKAGLKGTVAIARKIS